MSKPVKSLLARAALAAAASVVLLSVFGCSRGELESAPPGGSSYYSGPMRPKAERMKGAGAGQTETGATATPGAPR